MQNQHMGHLRPDLLPLRTESGIQGRPRTYAIGKIKPRITGEYRTSSSAILTIERSMLVNQLRSETNYGFQVNNSDKRISSAGQQASG